MVCQLNQNEHCAVNSVDFCAWNVPTSYAVERTTAWELRTFVRNLRKFVTPFKNLHIVSLCENNHFEEVNCNEPASC